MKVIVLLILIYNYELTYAESSNLYKGNILGSIIEKNSPQSSSLDQALVNLYKSKKNDKKSFQEFFIEEVKATCPECEVNVAFYPVARSKQPSSYENPRMVISLQGPLGPEYFGISSDGVSVDVEAITYDKKNGNFNFFKSTANGPGINDGIHGNVRGSCISCHQGGNPILERAPWSASNVMPQSGKVQVEMLKAKMLSTQHDAEQENLKNVLLSELKRQGSSNPEIMELYEEIKKNGLKKEYLDKAFALRMEGRPLDNLLLADASANIYGFPIAPNIRNDFSLYKSNPNDPRPPIIGFDESVRASARLTQSRNLCTSICTASFLTNEQKQLCFKTLLSMAQEKFNNTSSNNSRTFAGASSFISGQSVDVTISENKKKILNELFSINNKLRPELSSLVKDSKYTSNIIPDTDLSLLAPGRHFVGNVEARNFAKKNNLTITTEDISFGPGDSERVEIARDQDGNQIFMLNDSGQGITTIPDVLNLSLEDREALSLKMQTDDLATVSYELVAKAQVEKMVGINISDSDYENIAETFYNNSNFNDQFFAQITFKEMNELLLRDDGSFAQGLAINSLYQAIISPLRKIIETEKSAKIKKELQTKLKKIEEQKVSSFFMPTKKTFDHRPEIQRSRPIVGLLPTDSPNNFYNFLQDISYECLGFTKADNELFISNEAGINKIINSEENLNLENPLISFYESLAANNDNHQATKACEHLSIIIQNESITNLSTDTDAIIFASTAAQASSPEFSNNIFAQLKNAYKNSCVSCHKDDHVLKEMFTSPTVAKFKKSAKSYLHHLKYMRDINDVSEGMKEALAREEIIDAKGKRHSLESYLETIAKE